MSTVTEEQRETLRRQIDESFRKASAQRERLTRMDRRYSLTHTGLSGLSGMIAGSVAAVGRAPGGDWRLICVVAAVFAFGATLVSALQKQLSDPDLLAQTSECVGKLRALRVEAIAPGYSIDDVGSKYRQVLTEYAKVDC